MISLATRFILQQSKINKKDKSFNEKTTHSEPKSSYSTILNMVKKDTFSEIKDNYKAVKTNFINRFLNVLQLKPSPTEDSDDDSDSEGEGEGRDDGDNDTEFNNRYNTSKSASSSHKPRNISVTNSGTHYY